MDIRRLPGPRPAPVAVAEVTRQAPFGAIATSAPGATAGWVVNDKRIERIWRREGLKVPGGEDCIA